MLKEQRNKVTLTVVSWPGSLVWKLKQNSQQYQVSVGHHTKLNMGQINQGNAELLLHSVLPWKTFSFLFGECFFTVLKLSTNQVIGFKVMVNLNSCSFLGSLKLFRIGVAEKALLPVFLYKSPLRRFPQFQLCVPFSILNRLKQAWLSDLPCWSNTVLLLIWLPFLDIESFYTSF